jgi:3-deoxy-manno-octulosonate cytidylyltransferase (CMP-KDO synthetase)
MPESPPTPLPVAVIPARHASSRFPGKPLALIGGRPMVEHVYRRCHESGAFGEVLVATDDARIARAVEGFGGRVAMTSPACASGTDRVAEVAQGRPDVDVWVNVQGDEPLVAPEALAALAALFREPAVQMATLVRPLREEERGNPNVVKAVLALSGEALYFSRADVPHVRGGGVAPPRWAHLGLYGYRRETLLTLARLPPSPLEQAELLEQLRALEAGVRIRCAPVSWESVAVDTPEDLLRAEAAWAASRWGPGHQG